MDVVVRPASGWREITRIIELQQHAWGEVMVRQMIARTISAGGGQALVAEVDGHIVGFSLAIFKMHIERGYLYWFSELVGVLPSQQAGGIGHAIKLAQREQMLRFMEERPKLGVHPEMRWTVDPLLSKNAALNFRKCGAYATSVYPNLYGELGGTLYGSEPTDRFSVFWDLRRETRAPEFDHDAPLLLDPKSLEVNAELVEEAERHDNLLLPIPTDLPALRQYDAEAAAHWKRQAVSVLVQLLDVRDGQGRITSTGRFFVVNATRDPLGGHSLLMLQNRRVPREDGTWLGDDDGRRDGMPSDSPR
ncbi:MAG: hypothetical protein KDD44_01945 [Bdellovibrionales bacterium]|nr:hypothetical protein [Bdellovibrionales bacterium]